MPEPVVALAVLSAAAEGGKAYFQNQAAKAKEEGLDLQSKEMQLIHEQKSASNLDLLQKTLATQTAEASSRGYALNSPSFNAIQRSTFNAGARKEQNLDTEETLIERNLKTEKENVQTSLYSELFGDVAETAASAASIYKASPRLSGS